MYVIFIDFNYYFNINNSHPHLQLFFSDFNKYNNPVSSLCGKFGNFAYSLN